jgi:hypothetical protein
MNLFDLILSRTRGRLENSMRFICLLEVSKSIDFEAIMTLKHFAFCLTLSIVFALKVAHAEAPAIYTFCGKSKVSASETDLGIYSGQGLLVSVPIDITDWKDRDGKNLCVSGNALDAANLVLLPTSVTEVSEEDLKLSKSVTVCGLANTDSLSLNTDDGNKFYLDGTADILNDVFALVDQIVCVESDQINRQKSQSRLRVGSFYIPGSGAKSNSPVL